MKGGKEVSRSCRAAKKVPIKMFGELLQREKDPIKEDLAGLLPFILILI
jgi:hypothetical protein